MSYLPYLVAAWVCTIGLYGIVTSRNLIHLAVCLTVTQSSTYVLLLSVGYVQGGGPPIFKGVQLGTTSVDGREVKIAGWNYPLDKPTGLGKAGEHELGAMISERLNLRQAADVRS